MAIPYPEGAVFFQRDILKNAYYDATNEKSFYSHFMVEYIWNKEADHGRDANAPRGFSHPRSAYHIVRGSWWNTNYGNWENVSFSYGYPEHKIQRRFQHNLCINGNRLRDHEKGDAAEAFFMTMPMPTKEERWVWIDMLAHIRAIYIPLSFQANADYPHLSKWAQVNFTQNTKSTMVWRGDTFKAHSFDRTFGTGVSRDLSMGLDMTGLALLLSCPAEFRKMNSYQAKYIKMVRHPAVRHVPVQKSYSDGEDFSFIKVMSAQTGLNLEYSKAKRGTWLGDFLRSVINNALGFVPIVGPFLSAAFDLGWTAIADPDSFWYEFSIYSPAFKMIDLLKNELDKNREEVKSLVHERWLTVKPVPEKWTYPGGEKMVPMPDIIIESSGLMSATDKDEEMPVPVVKATSYFEDALIALNATGTNPGKYDKGDPEDVGEVVAVIPAGEYPEGGDENNSEEVQANPGEEDSEGVQA